jgi:hypothetical protein
MYMRVAARRYYARNLPSVCYLGACKFPPVLSVYRRILPYNPHDNQERRRRKAIEVHRTFKYNKHGLGDKQERRRRKAIEVTCTGFFSIISMARVTIRGEGGEKL